MSISEDVRKELVRLTRTPRLHGSGFSKERPTDWEPMYVRDPTGGLFGYFTETGAWELISEKLETGHHVEQVTLEKPPGKKGYVMHIDIGDENPLLYVKLEIVRGFVVGRSFHYSRFKGH